MNQHPSLLTAEDIHHNNNDHFSVASTNPPTRVITVKEHFTVSDQDEMLSLAQKKFDELRQHTRDRRTRGRVYGGSGSTMGGGGYGGTRGGRSRMGGMMRGESKEQVKVLQLLSSLLYLSLMMHKVEDMKKILETRDPTLYNEWQMLLETLHSPTFHLQERRFQNERVQKIFKRKKKYKELYDETEAKLMKLEETSRQMSHSVSKLSEENLKSLELLEKKNDVEKDLVSTKKELDALCGQLEKCREDWTSALTEKETLLKTVQDCEVEKARLQEKIQHDANSAIEASNEMNKVKKAMEEKVVEVQELGRQLTIVQTEKSALDRQIINDTTNHDKMLSDRDKIIAECKETIARHLTSLKQMEDDKTSSNSKHMEDKHKLEKSLIEATSATEIAKAETKMKLDEMEKLRVDLDLKSKAFVEAMESIRIEKESQSKLQEMIANKDRDINRLNASHMSIEKKLVDVEFVNKKALQEMEEGNIKLIEKHTSLEAKIKEHEDKYEEMSTLVEQSRTTETELRREKSTLEGLVSELRKDVDVKLDECTRLENTLKTNEASANEYRALMEDKQGKSLSEVSTLKLENQMLKQQNNELKEKLLKSESEVRDTKNAAEVELKKMQIELTETKTQLASTVAEVEVRRTSQHTFEKSITDFMQTKQNDQESDASAIQKSIDNLNAENSHMVKKMETIRLSIIQDIQEFLIKQKLNEENVPMPMNEVPVQGPSAITA